MGSFYGVLSLVLSFSSAFLFNFLFLFFPLLLTISFAAESKLNWHLFAVVS